MQTKYQLAKAELEDVVRSAKIYFGNNTPAINMAINDECDYICKNSTLSEYEKNLLCNYACTLHV